MDPDTLSRIIVLLFGRMDHGGPFWCYVAVKPSRYEAFQNEERAGTIDLYNFESFGEVVVSAEGERPPRSVTEQVAEMYGADPDSFFQPIDPMEQIGQRIEKLRQSGFSVLGPSSRASEPAPGSWLAKVTSPKKKAEPETTSDSD
jgi:hypothetical protein